MVSRVKEELKNPYENILILIWSSSKFLKSDIMILKLTHKNYANFVEFKNNPEKNCYKTDYQRN